jgi:hypothetical protein
MPRTLINSHGPTLSSPRWAGDYGSRDYLVPGGAKVDSAQFPADDAVTVVVGAAGAAIGAVSIPVAALAGPIPNGTVLTFGGVKVAQLSAPAAAGAVALTVNAIPTAVVSGDTATYRGTGKIRIPSGTALGRTIAERNAGTGFGPAGAADDEVFLNFFDVTDAASVDDVELYRPGGTVYENYLPAFATLAGGVQTILRARYQCTVGV